jgi:thiol-disulfide isomerase/thioredoxin
VPFFSCKAGQGACFFLMLCALGVAHAQNKGAVMQFDLPKLDGSSLTRLSDLPSTVVVVNFWRSDCPPCVEEMHLLNLQAQQLPAVKFIGIATEEAAKAKRFLARHPSGYLQLGAPLASEGLMRRFGNKTGALPYTAVLNPQRQLCQTKTGLLDAHWLAQALSACSAKDKH